MTEYKVSVVSKFILIYFNQDKYVSGFLDNILVVLILSCFAVVSLVNKNA